ncbi:MAG: tetratricopeptide repeat protein [Leptolyngbyaceae cyanobacterium]
MLLTVWDKLKRAGCGICWVSFWSLLLLGLPGGEVSRALAAPSTFQLGTTALHQQQYELAIHHFDQTIAQGQHLEESHSYQCFAWLMLNEPQQAHQSCEMAVMMNPDHAQANFYHGLALYRLNRFGAAIAALDHHLRLHPEDARAYYNCGLAKFAQGDVSGAIVQYRQALAYGEGLAPVERSNLYNDLGLAYWQSHQSDAAKLALDQAVLLDQEDIRAHFNRGCICHHRGEYLAALDEFDQVLRLDSSHAKTYLNRGLVNQQMGHRQAAIQDYRTAVEQFQQQGELAAAQKAKLRLHQLQRDRTAVG